MGLMPSGLSAMWVPAASSRTIPTPPMGPCHPEMPLHQERAACLPALSPPARGDGGLSWTQPRASLITCPHPALPLSRRMALKWGKSSHRRLGVDRPVQGRRQVSKAMVVRGGHTPHREKAGGKGPCGATSRSGAAEQGAGLLMPSPLYLSPWQREQRKKLLQH